MPHGFLLISRMPHNFIYNIYYATRFIHNIPDATPLVEAIQRYLLGSICALLGRGTNADNDAFDSLRALFDFGRNCNGDTGNAVAGDATGDAGAGDATGDASAGPPTTDEADAGDACTSRGRALTSLSEFDNSSPAATLAAISAFASSFAFAFAFALACSTKGSNSFSNSKPEDSVDILESLKPLF
jgi:hypothetical protein